MINYNLKKIKALLFDVDGVLSCQTIPVDTNGVPLRTVNIKDGYAIQLACKLGLTIGIITGGSSQSIVHRYDGLGVKEIHLGAKVKVEVYKDVLSRLGLQDDEVLFMGDDIPDYEVMTECGLPCCPKDAVQEIQGIATYVSPYTGGNGCARDVIEQVLRAQGLWNLDKIAFGW